MGRVGETETGAQLRHLRANVGGPGIATCDLARGGDALVALAALPFPKIDFFTCSDVLYIALRDGLGSDLLSTVVSCARIAAPGGV